MIPNTNQQQQQQQQQQLIAQQQQQQQQPLKATAQDLTNNFFLFNPSKSDDDVQQELPLIPLNSRFSVNSSINPVRGLEMKRLISVNQEGAAEPYIDLSHGYSQLFANSYQQQQQQQQQLGNNNNNNNNQNAFIPDLTNQQSNNNYFPGYNASNQQSMNFDLLNPAFIDATSFQNTLSANPRQLYEHIQQQNQQQQQQNQQFFNNSSNTNNASLQQQLLQAKNNNNNANTNNLIFKNPDALNSSNNKLQNPFLLAGNTNNAYTSSIPNYIAQLGQQQQQQHALYEKDFLEKKEELDVDGSNNNLSSTATGLQINSNDEALKNTYALNTLKQKQQQLQNFQAQQQFQNNNNQLFQLQQQQHHQQYINHEEAEYMNEARSNGDDEQHRYQHQPFDLRRNTAINNNNNNKNNLQNPQQQQQQQLNNNHTGQEDEYDEDDEGYTNNMDSHTRHKTEWPSRPKGQTKYQQCRHRNIFKNFGNIFRKFVSFHSHFTEKALGMLGNDQESLKAFQKWLKKDIRLENKKDFIEGWTIWVDEDEQIRQFKILLKELSRDFFQDYILIYLLNSKLQDLEIHLRSIGPCLAAINLPSILYKFRPI